MPSDVSTSTLQTFLITIFDQTLTVLIYALEFTWPYLLAAGVFWLFYRVARTMWHGR